MQRKRNDIDLFRASILGSFQIFYISPLGGIFAPHPKKKKLIEEYVCAREIETIPQVMKQKQQNGCWNRDIQLFQ